MASRFDDEIWELVTEDPASPPAHLARFVTGLARVADALDVGCGDGRLTELVPAERVTAADVSAQALERAGKRLPEARLVELDPDAPLPFGDAAFDLVLCVETVEHVRDVQLLLSEARRVLRPGGTLALTTPAHARATALVALVRGWDRVFDPLTPHLRFFSGRSLSRLLGEMGFECRLLERRHGTLLATATR